MTYLGFIIVISAMWITINLVYRLLRNYLYLKQLIIDVKYGFILLIKRNYGGFPGTPGRRLMIYVITISMYSIALSISLYILVSMVYRGLVIGVREVVVLVPGLNITGLDLLNFMVGVLIGVSIHEYLHAKISLSSGIPVKSYGFILALIIPGAFVEIDEERFKEAGRFIKIAILAAGIVGNMTLWFLSSILINYTTSPYGLVIVDIEKGSLAERSGILVYDVIYRVNRTELTLSELRSYLVVNQTILLVFEVYRPGIGYVDIYVLKEAFENKLGVQLSIAPQENIVDKIHPSLFLNLFKTLYWIYIVNFSLMFLNTLPLYITDGGKIVREITSSKLYNVINTATLAALITALILNARI